MLLGSVTLQKILWSWWAGIPGWNFNRMNDSEEHKNKVRRGKKEPQTVELVQIRQMTAAGYIKHIVQFLIWRTTTNAGRSVYADNAMISPQPRGRMRLLGGYLHLNNPPQPTIQVMEIMRQTRGSLTEGLRRHYVSSKQEKNSIHLPMDLVLDQTQDPWSKGLCRRTLRLSCLPMMVRMALTCFWFHMRE